MGIYPDVTYKSSFDVLIRTTSTPGLTVIDTFVLHERREERTDCYCCSCNEDENGIASNRDPYCRNHGFAGKRICMKHRMSGDAYECGPDLDVLDETSPLLSVQAALVRDPAARVGWEATETEKRIYNAVMQ